MTQVKRKKNNNNNKSLHKFIGITLNVVVILWPTTRRVQHILTTFLPARHARLSWSVSYISDYQSMFHTHGRQAVIGLSEHTSFIDKVHNVPTTARDDQRESAEGGDGLYVDREHRRRGVSSTRAQLRARTLSTFQYDNIYHKIFLKIIITAKRYENSKK